MAVGVGVLVVIGFIMLIILVVVLCIGNEGVSKDSITNLFRKGGSHDTTRKALPDIDQCRRVIDDSQSNEVVVTMNGIKPIDNVQGGSRDPRGLYDAPTANREETGDVEEKNTGTQDVYDYPAYTHDITVEEVQEVYDYPASTHDITVKEEQEVYEYPSPDLKLTKPSHSLAHIEIYNGNKAKSKERSCDQEDDFAAIYVNAKPNPANRNLKPSPVPSKRPPKQLPSNSEENNIYQNVTN